MFYPKIGAEIYRHDAIILYKLESHTRDDFKTLDRLTGKQLEEIYHRFVREINQ